MRLAGRRLLRGCRPRLDSTLAAVVADMVHRDVVHHSGVVHVRYMHRANVVHAAVVIEPAVAPVSALVPNPAIAVTVVNASVEANRRPPVAGMPEERAASPSPITGSPQQARLRRRYPCSGDPVISARTISPIPRCPNVAHSRARRLHIHRQRRRSEPNRYEYPGE